MSNKTTTATPPVEMKKEQGCNTNTELCVNLKTKLWNDKRMETGKVYRGTIRRTTTSEPYHYDELFVFTEAQRAQPVRRNPHIYEGDCINVNQAPDGTIYPTFNRPKFTEQFTFQDFCREAAEELLKIVSLVEK